MTENEGVRLQKVLAEAGIGSRRHCEELIGEGRVTVNGKKVFRFGERVDPQRAVIHVDGKRVETRSEMRYYAINKPRGVVSTMSDERGRRSSPTTWRCPSGCSTSGASTPTPRA